MNHETAVLAGGCFWCTEAVFQRLKGVESVVPGYIGGVNPATYEEVSRGDTGHAEAVQIMFDPKIITFRQLLEVFFAIHDPTTMNRQGNDEGTQYRSAIFYDGERQKQISQEIMAEIPGVVTELAPKKVFYPAEEYHKDYYNLNAGKNSYCRAVIDPKLKKLFVEFPSRVR